MKYKIIKNPEVAPKLTLEEAIYFGIDVSLENNQGFLKTKGPWSIPVSYKALAISKKYNRDKGYTVVEEITIYGQRVLSKLKTSGYVQEGTVSLNSKSHSAFTSLQLFDVEGKLINVATIHVRTK